MASVFVRARLHNWMFGTVKILMAVIYILGLCEIVTKQNDVLVFTNQVCHKITSLANF